VKSIRALINHLERSGAPAKRTHKRLDVA
jgi:hypothetical protein